MGDGTGAGGRDEREGQRDGVKSAHRALAILELLAQSDRPMTFAEIGTALSLPRSSLFGLLNTLRDRGWIDLAEGERGYRLGIRTLEAGNAYQRSLDLLVIAKPHMERIRDALDETVQISVLEGRRNIYLDKVEGGQRLRLDSEVGRRLPAHATALGKVLLADLPDDAIGTLFDGIDLETFTATTIPSLDALRKELAAIRERGFAEDREEHTVGVRCFAYPIRNHTGRTIAALSVSFPTVRFTPERGESARTLLGDATHAISMRLGHAAHPGHHLPRPRAHDHQDDYQETIP
ncbi:MAG: IclR family transcriptional regulator, partial [Thermomicrobiales bacterium]